MSNGHSSYIDSTIKTVATIAAVLGSAGFGAWILRVWERYRENRKQDAQERKQNEATTIGQYQNIIAFKDQEITKRDAALEQARKEWQAEFEQARQDWYTEKQAIVNELTVTRQHNQRLLIDYAAMAERIRLVQLQLDAKSEGAGPIASVDRYDPVIISGPSGKVEWANEPASYFLGWPIQDMIGMPITAFVPPDLRATHDRAMNRALSRTSGSPEMRVVRTKSLRSDGSEWPVDVILSIFIIHVDIMNYISHLITPQQYQELKGTLQIGVCVARAQLRRRFEAPKPEVPGPVYTPGGAASSIEAPPVTLVPDATGVADATVQETLANRRPLLPPRPRKGLLPPRAKQ